jgi:hypothetical protein
MLRMYAKVNWNIGTFYRQAIGAHLSPRGSDIREVYIKRCTLRFVIDKMHVVTGITWHLKALVVLSRTNGTKLVFTAISTPNERHELQQGPRDPLLGVFDTEAGSRVQEVVPVPVG